MNFECKSKSGCVKARFGLPGECHAARLLDEHMCELGDPQSEIYSPDYEEYLKETPRPEAVRAEYLKPIPPPTPPPGYTPGLLNKIEECPHRSIHKIETREDGVQVRKHLFKDGTEAAGCGCGKMRCRLGRGEEGNVTLDDCKACIAEQESVEKPSLLQKAASVTKAVVKHVSSGMQNVPDNVKNGRLDICAKCIHHDNGTCKVCGCILSVKVVLPNEKCPLTTPRWDVYQISGEAAKAGD